MATQIARAYRRRISGKGRLVPRYYLDVHNALVTKDEEGMEFPTVEAMLAEIATILPEMLADEPLTTNGQSHLSIHARDENGSAVGSGTIVMQVSPFAQDEDAQEQRKRVQQRLGELARRAADVKRGR